MAVRHSSGSSVGSGGATRSSAGGDAATTDGGCVAMVYLAM